MFISSMQWQDFLVEAQELAVRMSSTELSSDKLASLSLDNLLGTLAYLKRLKAENSLD